MVGLKQDTAIKLAQQEQPEQTVALNPLTGLHLDDLREILATTVKQGARQPLILGKHVAGHARKLVEVLARLIWP